VFTIQNRDRERYREITAGIFKEEVIRLDNFFFVICCHSDLYDDSCAQRSAIIKIRTYAIAGQKASGQA